MILNILAGIKEISIKDAAPFDAKKPTGPSECGLGELSGLLLGLWVALGEQLAARQFKEADALDARSAALRNAEDFAAKHKSEKAWADYERAKERFELLQKVFWLEVAEEFGISGDCFLGIRAGFTVVRFNREAGANEPYCTIP